MIRLVLAAGLLLGCAVLASAQTTLRVGDQKGNSQAVMEAAGVLKDVPYKIEWKEFPAAAPLLEALGAGAIEPVWSATRRSPSPLLPTGR
jgi:sulfonate transport system substrate-binding protein